jgi:hypothetical protein
VFGNKKNTFDFPLDGIGGRFGVFVVTFAVRSSGTVGEGDLRCGSVMGH